MTKLILQALRGEEVARRPVWLMRQAGRMLPEYRALREKHSFLELSGNPELAAEVTLQPLRRFDYDAAILFADLMSPVEALGLDFHFDPGPVVPKPIRSAGDLKRLHRPGSEEIAPKVMATLRRVRAQLPEHAALLGFGGAPWTLAGYLVQGHGKTEFPQLRAMLHSSPAVFGQLMERLAELVAEYLIQQHRAGAEAVQIFDSWAGLLGIDDWRRFVRPHLWDLLTALGQAAVPRILFVQGAPHLVDEYADLPAECLSVCWRTDLAALRKRLGAGRPVQGNLDPALLLAGPETTASVVRAFLSKIPKRGHIVNLGHGVLPQTPIDSVQALLAEVRVGN